MKTVAAAHFGGNIVLTNDSATQGSSFREMLKEISFSNFRYPGGGVTEDQTWANGGLKRMFGNTMDPQDPNYVMTIREALRLSEESGASIRIVIPTYQFYDKDTKEFDHFGFKKYIIHLERALDDVPNAKVSAFEIGNEFWAELTPRQYGFIANEEIPQLRALAERVADVQGSSPEIGLQAGATWRATSSDESRAIGSQLSVANRGAIGEIVQHSYPDAQREQMDWQIDWAVNPMKVYAGMKGFSDDLGLVLTEYNIARTAGEKEVFGVNQAAIWVEQFHAFVEAGITGIDSWGINYKWLTNKFYDAKFSPAESDNGKVTTIATPMGQVYDIVSSHLVGMDAIADRAALQGIDASRGLEVTGFSDAHQRVVFISNRTGHEGTLDISDIQNRHVTAFHIVPADSPESSWYNESTLKLEAGRIIDARGDMNVASGTALKDMLTIGRNELIALVVSNGSSRLHIEGAHHQTDPTNRMVNDVIEGGRRADSIYGYVGDDFLYGRGGDDRAFGGEGSDHIYGNRGADRICGGSGEDSLFGGSGRDTISGGVGNDVIRGGGGGDRVDGGDGADWIIGEGGWDNIQGNAGADTIHGGGGNDRIWGGDGDDILWAGSGNDWIRGGAGDDRIYGGSGADDLWGGEGADTFFFFPLQGNNVVHDFDPAEDRLVIRGTSGDDDFYMTETPEGLEIASNGTSIILEIAPSFEFDDISLTLR